MNCDFNLGYLVALLYFDSVILVLFKDNVNQCEMGRLSD